MTGVQTCALPIWDIIHISETDSTNRWLKAKASEAEALGCKPQTLRLQGLNPKVSDGIVVWTDYQTAGRGCGTNSWDLRGSDRTHQ